MAANAKGIAARPADQESRISIFLPRKDLVPEKLFTVRFALLTDLKILQARQRSLQLLRRSGTDVSAREPRGDQTAEGHESGRHRSLGFPRAGLMKTRPRSVSRFPSVFVARIASLNRIRSGTQESMRAESRKIRNSGHASADRIRWPSKPAISCSGLPAFLRSCLPEHALSTDSRPRAQQIPPNRAN